MRKKIKILIIAFIISFSLNFSVVSALPVSLGKLSKPSGAHDTLDGFGTTFKTSSAEGATGAVLCTKHDSKSPGGENTECEIIKDDWSTQVRAGVAAIIEKAELNNEKITNNYIYAVYTINQFLYDKRNDGSNSVVFDTPGQNVVEKYSKLSTHDTYKDYMKAANDAYDYAVNPIINMSVQNLTFTLKGDAYVSNEVTITSDSELTMPTTNDFAILNKISDNKYTVSVPKDKVKIGESLTVTINVSAQKSVLQARNYYCGEYTDTDDYDNDNDKTEVVPYQTVTPANYDILPLTTTKTISGQINLTTSLTIKKLDESKSNLPGVVLKVEGKENDYSQTFTTTDKEIKIENLKFGKYIITEVSTPEGYVKLKEPKEVVISEENLNEVITLTNLLTRVEISKVSSADKKLLSGAVLQLQDKDGNVLINQYDKKYEWTTTDEVHVIIGLAPGTYYLAEISSPEGYELNKERIEFEVDGETEVIEVKMENNIEVEVPNTLSSRSALLITISMFDIFLGIGIITYVKKNKVQE